jgi:hypothetical protein
MPEEAKKEGVRNKSKFLGILGILLFAGGAIMSGLVIKEQPQVLGLSAQSEVTSLISQVGKLIVLPSNELPTATTINDLTKLKNQYFFRNAKKNDKLLDYTNIKWAVLYRPSENKIIEVGAFDINQSVTTSPTVSPSPSPTPSPTPPSITPSPSPTPSPTPPVSPGTSPVLSPTH